MITQTVHKVESVYVRDIGNRVHEDGSDYVVRKMIINFDGIKLELTLFADNREQLSIEI